MSPTESRVSFSGGRPLAPAQRPLWLSQRLHPDAPVQNMALVTHIEARVDPERLARAFAQVVEANDVLRSRFVEEASRPVVRLDAEPQAIEIVAMDRAAVDDWAAKRASVALDPTIRGYDSVLLPHPDGTLSWYLCLHHTITDATSSALVFAATAAAYHGRAPVPTRYYEWAAALASGSGRDRKAVAHWAARDPAPALDRLYQPVRHATADATRLPVELDDTSLARLDEHLQGAYRMLSPDLGWTTLLVTATAIYLHQVAGADRSTIGLPVHNRTEVDTRTLIGPVMEVFPVDVDVHPDDTFRSLHKRVGRAVLTTLGNARPGTAPPADHAAVVNVIPRAGVGPFGSHPTTTRWIHAGAIDSNHLLRVQLSAYDGAANAESGPPNGQPVLALDLNHGGADPQQRLRAPGHLTRILSAMVEDPDLGVTQPVVADDELAALQRWERGPEAVADGTGLVDRLRAALAERSNTVLTDGDRTWTGSELWGDVLANARWLRSQGLRDADRVAVQMPRSADAVVAILAVMVAGGSFVPLDPTQPARRLRDLIRRARCRLVLTSLPSADRLATASVELTTIGPADPEQEAYLLFTSGSTGQPKGVPITHFGLDRYLRFATEHYVEPGTNPVVPLFSALTFDLTITSLFVPLVTGGEQLVIRPDGPAGLAAIAAEPRINWCKATPSHLEVLLRLLPPEHGLRTIVVGGEAFGAGLARRLLDFRADLAIFNEYGPTEAVVGCMIHRVDPAHVEDHPEVPIGVPAPGVTLRVVGPGLRRAPIGSAGELLIAHQGLTSGYLRDPDDADQAENNATEGPFVHLGDAEADPSDAELETERFYRSGDLVRLVDENTLVYLGRIDEQVKVGGIRLEPTEVSDALTGHRAIAAAAVRLWSPRREEPDHRCTRCGLASNVPGTSFGDDGVCNVCRDYDRVAPQAAAWFRTPEDLLAKRDDARARRSGRHDCLHLLSGGKDSTYALYQLVEAGFEPYALTLDNGFISDEAKENVRRSVADLGIDHEFVTTDAMHAIFRDSLERHSNVCHGCYKTIYTIATNRAVALGIPMIVTGLSRGQLFETRLIPQQFAPGRFDPDAIDRAVIEARKAYHRVDDGPNRLLDTDVFANDDIFDLVEYLDFYRYVDVELTDLLSFLDTRAPWVRPSDTGRSTNCLINAAGIHTHLIEQGYHNYAEPYAWDVRLGHKTRSEAIEELDDQLDPVEVRQMLDTIGYVPTPPEILTAWIEPEPETEPPSPAELRATLAEILPAHAIPAAFVMVDRLPLTTNGKLDAAALPAPERVHRSATGITVAAESDLEATIIDVWEKLLRIEPIGATDDYFALGGDSLGALEMVVALGERLGRLIPDEYGFAHPTPRALAAAIEATRSAANGEPLEQPPSQPTDWSAASPPPLGPGEQALLFEQALRPDATMYNIGRLYVVNGLVDTAALGRAISAVAARHVPLNWSFGRPRTHLAPSEALAITVAETPLSVADFEAEARNVHQRPFDLVNGPLLRAWIQPLDDDTTAVLLVAHHIVADAESFDRFWTQIDAELHGRPVVPAIDYATFIAWQQDQLDDDDARHWLPRRSGDGHADTRASLHLEPPVRPTPDGYLVRRSSIDTADLARPGTTPFAAGLAGLAAMLRRRADGDLIELGMVVSTRSRPADDLIGYFVNALPVLINCSPGDDLAAVVDEARKAVSTNLPHRAYPYSRIVDERRRAGEEPPPLRILAVQDEMGSATLLGLDVQQRVLAPGAAVADATFWFQDRDGELHLGLEYRGSVMDGERATQLLDDLDATLVTLARAPATTVGELPLPTAESSVLHGPPLDAPDTLLDAFAHNAATHGERDAVVCGGRRLSWSDLAAASEDVAHRLADLGIGRGDRVLVAMPRSVELMAAIVGVLRAGAAYVPVDPSYPEERIAAIVRAAGASATLTAPGMEPPSADGPVLIVDAGEGRQARPGPRPTLHSPTGDDIAYVIFTSGSTGTPRGVPVTHRMLAASTTARSGVYARRVERFLLVSSLAFDSSVAGLFWALVDGGTIVLPTDTEARDPDALVGLFAAERITHTLLVPTLYRALLSRDRNTKQWPVQVIVAGEACPASLLHAHFEARPFSALTNEYGPTETTVWATAHHCSPGDDPVPIGVPIPGTWVAVVDAAGNLRPAGAAGELVIGGAGLVDGYHREPGATAARFAESALGRHFRTGDRAVVRDGAVHFLGRLDNQLNVGGVRAEPEDIERVLEADPAVGAAVVTAIDPRPVDELMADLDPEQLRQFMRRVADDADPAGALVRLMRTAPGTNPRLVAFIEAADNHRLDVSSLRARARNHLPPLLRPTEMVLVDELPQSPNGKIDRVAAAGLAVPMAEPASVVVATPHENDGADRIAELFTRTLRLDGPPGPDESFFELGGHSLAAMELLADIERAFGVELTVSTLYEHDTAAALAAVLRERSGPEIQNRFLVPIQPKGSLPPLFGVHVLGVNAEFYRPLAAALGPDQPVWGLGLPTATPDTSNPTEVREVAARYVAELERRVRRMVRWHSLRYRSATSSPSNWPGSFAAGDGRWRCSPCSTPSGPDNGLRGRRNRIRPQVAGSRRRADPIAHRLCGRPVEASDRTVGLSPGDGPDPATPPLRGAARRQTPDPGIRGGELGFAAQLRVPALRRTHRCLQGR